MTATRLRQAIISTRPSSANRFWSGVGSRFSVIRNPAMRPNSVFIPIAVTTPRPLPATTVVPVNTTLARSAIPTSWGNTATLSFSMGVDSPVRAASCIFNANVVTSRASAGTWSPASTSTTSPGTSVSAGRMRSEPSRITLATGEESSFERRKGLLGFLFLKKSEQRV